MQDTTGMTAMAGGKQRAHCGHSSEEVGPRLPAERLLQLLHLDERLVRPPLKLLLRSHDGARIAIAAR